MDWFTSIWNTVEPFFMEGLRWLVNTGVGASIALFIVKKWEKKHSDTNLASNIASSVTNGIVSKDILVSLESVNKAQLNSIKEQLLEKFSGAFEFIALQNDALTAMAKIMIKFKAASEEEKQELINAINKIETKEHKKLTTETKTEPVVITIEPVKETNVTDESLF